MSAARGISAGSYVRAGQSAVDNTIGTIRAARRNAPDYGDIASEGIKQRAATKAAGIKAESDVAQAGIRAEAAVRKSKIVADRDKSLARSEATVRKAGKIAAAGTLIGDGITEGKRARDKEEFLTEFWNKQNERDAGKMGDLDTEIEGTYSTDDPEVPDVPSEAPAPTSDPMPAPESPVSQTTQTKPDSNTSLQPVAVPPKSSTIASTTVAPSGVNLRALREAISWAEGTWNPNTNSINYNTQFGGGQFDGSKGHPQQVIRGTEVSSSAAGGYQFMPTTWKEANQGKNVPMTPANQDAAADFLISRRGVDLSKPLEGQIGKLAGEWASVPTYMGTSYYNMDGKPYATAGGIAQPSKSREEFLKFYRERVKAQEKLKS